MSCGGACGSISYMRKRRIFVYDVDIDKKIANCLIETCRKGCSDYEKKDIKIDKLRKFIKKSDIDFDIQELYGISIKKNGEFKLKPKDYDRVAVDIFIKKEVPDIKKHIKHLKKVKKQLKMEKEQNKDFDYDER